jgi:hypothetical protein
VQEIQTRLLLYISEAGKKEHFGQKLPRQHSAKDGAKGPPSLCPGILKLRICHFEAGITVIKRRNGLKNCAEITKKTQNGNKMVTLRIII